MELLVTITVQPPGATPGSGPNWGTSLTVPVPAGVSPPGHARTVIRNLAAAATEPAEVPV